MWGFWRARRILATSDVQNLTSTGATDTQGFSIPNPIGALIPGLPSFQELFANSRHLAFRVIEIVLGGTLIVVGLSEIANPKVQQFMNTPAMRTAVKAIK